MSTETPVDLPAEETARPTGRHPVDIAHLVMGVAFAGMTLVWALVVSDVVGDDDIRWLLPVPWVLAGVAGLVGLVVSDRRRTGRQQRGWVEGR
jgi:hypothetical protein